MNVHPYRTAAAVVAAQRPWWQRALATLPAFACSWSRTYRRARGGRWSYVIVGIGHEHPALEFAWVRVEACQGREHASWASRHTIPSPACFVTAHPGESECNCEVWPETTERSSR
jgi:hypothetical protein